MSADELHRPSGPNGPLAYGGLSGRTRVEKLHIGCECGMAIALDVHRSINVVDDPELVELFYRDELDQARCPNCGNTHVPRLQRVFHDPRAPVLILDLPKEEAHRELQLTAELLQQLDREGADIPRYAKRPLVVYGPDALRQALRLSDVATSSRVTSEEGAALEFVRADVEGREVALKRREETLRELARQIEQRQGEIGEQLKELERHRQEVRALAGDLALRSSSSAEAAGEPLVAPTGEALELPGRPQVDIDRWRAGESECGVFVREGRVFLVARPGTALHDFRLHSPRLLLQLHELDGLPLVCLAAVCACSDDRALSLHWLLDPRVRRHREVIDALTDEFVVDLDLYDDESRAVASWRLRAPLDENMRLASARAERLLGSSMDADVSFEALAAAFAALGSERLGHRDPGLDRDAFTHLVTPTATRVALSVTDYWSIPANEDYLLFVRSFPLPWWRSIRERVVRAALEFGLCLGERLEEFAVEQALVGSRRELCQRVLHAFVELLAGRQLNDLDPSQEWLNWRCLAARCASEGVALGKRALQLRETCAYRVRQIIGPQVEEAPPNWRSGARTSELDLSDIIAQEELLDQEDEGGEGLVEPVQATLGAAEELEDDAIVDEAIIAEDDSAANGEPEDEDVAYDPPDSMRTRTVEVSDDDIIERSSSDRPEA